MWVSPVIFQFEEGAWVLQELTDVLGLIFKTPCSSFQEHILFYYYPLILTSSMESISLVFSLKSFLPREILKHMKNLYSIQAPSFVWNNTSETTRKHPKLQTLKMLWSACLTRLATGSVLHLCSAVCVDCLLASECNSRWSF